MAPAAALAAPVPATLSPEALATNGGTIRLHNLKTVARESGELVAVSRSGEIAVADDTRDLRAPGSGRASGEESEQEAESIPPPAILRQPGEADGEQPEEKRQLETRTGSGHGYGNRRWNAGSCSGASSGRPSSARLTLVNPVRAWVSEPSMMTA